MADSGLTQVEHAAMDLLSGLTMLLSKDIIGGGPSRAADLAEAVSHIHALQGMIMSQAAARAYPDRYRLLGEAAGAATTQERKDG